MNEPQPVSPTARPARLHSLDAFRGCTIAAMLLVNNPGSWSHVYPPLRHAAWHGWTPTDLIFPFFVFIMGVAVPFSLCKYTEADHPVTRALLIRVVRRVGLLVLLGLLLNGFPTYDLAGLRLPGVLQRLGLVYGLTVVIVLWAPPRTQLAIGVAILSAYWAALTLIPIDGVRPALGPEHNLARLIDRAIIPPAHLWSGSPTDPEGLLSTLPAVVTCLLGVFAGRWLRAGREATRDSDAESCSAVGCALRRLLWTGCALTLLGLLWGLVLPINKTLWTSSYVCLTAGLAMVALGGCHWAIDLRGWRWLGRPFESIGVNAITAFVLAGVVARVITRIPLGDGMQPKSWLFTRFAEWAQNPELASLAYAGVFVVVICGVVSGLSRLGVRFRV